MYSVQETTVAFVLLTKYFVDVPALEGQQY